MSKSQGSKGQKKIKDQVVHLLEAGTLKKMREAKEITNARVKFEWEHYSELARQRSVIEDKIKQSLIQTSIPYEIKKWQRAVKYKYSLHPLSTLGSLNYIGGRFNTGNGVNSEVPVFPALYIAEDKDTVLQEHLSQEAVNYKFELTPREAVLTNPVSETIVSISGQLDKIFDLTKISNLQPFVDLIKNFKLSKELLARAKQLGRKELLLIKTAQMLHKTLLYPHWREEPAQYDIPANSQVFGHLVYLAGIEGILYRSKFTEKLCLAIFPRNFVDTDSFIRLDDAPPHDQVPGRLDATNWRISEMDIKEILNK